MPYKDKEVNKRYWKQYWLDHKEGFLIHQREWRKSNPEYYKQYMKGWRKSEKARTIGQRHYNKRRGLGFFPLNKFFKGSEPHHISQNFIIYIPRKTHKNIWHNIWTWHNMDIINKLAFKFAGMVQR